MSTQKDKSLTIIVRATGETTMSMLTNQLKKQMSIHDDLFLLDQKECFEDKLKRGFELAIQEGRGFAVFIDADILLRKHAIKQIKKQIKKLDDTDLGFGLRLWDRFYDRPKYRGLHVYRTNLLESAISVLPTPNLKLRPESFTKQKLKEQGHAWRNDISHYIAGIHDFYQKPEDIYYKFLVRSKRSEHDIMQLKQKFRLAHDTDFKIALKGIEDGEQMEEISNNKFLYKNENNVLPKLNQSSIYSNQSVDRIVLFKLIKYYRFNNLFWQSI